MTPRSGLRRFVDAPAPTPDPIERCEMCGEPAGEPHGHVVDLENRSIMCACRPCYLLFTRPDSGAGRYRAVPERFLHDPDHPISRVEWDAVGIPVGSVFFLRGDNGMHAFYPSPAGATECELDLAVLAELSEKHPLLTEAEPDVEAVLVRGEADGLVEAYVVPIDSCYELVGTVRMLWQGFDGGAEAKAAIDACYDRIRTAARPLREG
jgi:hypothetical protein